jgi:AcrR family transcriptional regulator
MMAKRSYTLGKRAAKQEETRRRIVDAAVELHETLGPARTTISAIAERASVERLTVYRHFPTEEAIFTACSGRYEELHPFPDSSEWFQISDPEERLLRALESLYDYYESVAPMLTKVLRDAPEVPSMDDAVGRAQEMIGKFTRDALDPATERSMEIAVRLATSFDTWRHLSQLEGLSSAEAAEVMVAMATSLSSSVGERSTI